MSLYTLATTSLTTPDDRKRRPAMGAGQVARTLVLCLLVSFGLVGAQRANHAGLAPSFAADARAR